MTRRIRLVLAALALVAVIILAWQRQPELAAAVALGGAILL
jgi:hypothetical protein